MCITHTNIPYTYSAIQVSKGLELVPRNETFDLAESLQLPIDCVNGLQASNAVKMEPLSPDICRFIISDKQVWSFVCNLS